jgi:addiction module HigA family antidote
MNAKKEHTSSPVEGFAFEPAHPGAILRDELDARSLSANALALKLRVPANRVTEILNGKRGVSPETALRLSRCLGPSAAFWLGLQSQYDLAQAQARVGARILKEVEAAA